MEAAREVRGVRIEVEPSARQRLVFVDIGWVDAERLCEMRLLSNYHRAARVGRIEPLVRIQRDRVGARDSHEERAELLRQRGNTSVRTVNVQPEILFLTDVGDLREWIDGAGPNCSGRGDDSDWTAPGVAVASNCIAQ